jgi:hypothetical protein
LEIIKEGVTWVGVHSSLANKMSENALNAKYVVDLRVYDNVLGIELIILCESFFSFSIKISSFNFSFISLILFVFILDTI